MALNKDISDQLAESCRILGSWDMTHGAEGHVSFWDGESESIHIRGKGSDQLGVRYTRSSDIVEVDFEANTLAGGSEGVRSPSEAFLHTWLFRKNPEIRSVIHMHPRHALLLTICEKEIFPMHGRAAQGAKIAAEGIDTYPTSITIHDHEKGEKFANFMGKKRSALMRGHGVTVVGTSIEDATVRALELNELLKLTYEAYLLGDPKPLPQGDIDHLLQEPEVDRPRGAAGGEKGMLANYRYYAMMAGELEVPDKDWDFDLHDAMVETGNDPTPVGGESITELQAEIRRLREEIVTLKRHNLELLHSIVERDHERPPHWG